MGKSFYNLNFDQLEEKKKDFIEKQTIKPYYSYIFDTLIKTYILNNIDGYNSQKNRLKKKNFLLEKIISILIKINFIFCNSHQKILFIHGNRHTGLFDYIKDFSKNNNFVLIEGLNIINLRFLKISIPIMRLISFLVPLQKISEAIDLRLKNLNFVDEIESNIERKYTKIFSKIFLKNNIKIIIIENGGYTPQSKFLLDVAKKNNIKTLVFAAGIIQHSHCMGYLPISSDILWLWTKNDLDYLKRFKEHNINSNIFVGGIPMEFNENIKLQQNTVDQKKYLLFIAEQIRPLPDKKFLDYMDDIFGIIYDFNKKSKIECLIKLHPKQKEKENKNLSKLKNFSKIKKYLIDKKIQDCFYNSIAIFGTNSTALIEGIHIGLPTFILKDYSRMNNLNGNYINIQELAFYLDKSQDKKRISFKKSHLKSNIYKVLEGFL